MKKSKTSISKAESLEQIADYWDTHDLTDHWDQTQEVDCIISIESEKFLFSLDTSSLEKLRKIATSRGISIETLINIWVHEKTTKAA